MICHRAVGNLKPSSEIQGRPEIFQDFNKAPQVTPSGNVLFTRTEAEDIRILKLNKDFSRSDFAAV
jgi:hypothetical protein